MDCLAQSEESQYICRRHVVVYRFILTFNRKDRLHESS